MEGALMPDDGPAKSQWLSHPPCETLRFRTMILNIDKQGSCVKEAINLDFQTS